MLTEIVAESKLFCKRCGKLVETCGHKTSNGPYCQFCGKNDHQCEYCKDTNTEQLSNEELTNQLQCVKRVLAAVVLNTSKPLSGELDKHSWWQACDEKELTNLVNEVIQSNKDSG